ncbi:glucoamylase family protein [Belliella marina]|uniref:Glucoamylase family protein n=1 Tax=Belliella marina TaxID=1644146 RepID=A0ABW4VMR0_9BACT
MKRFTILFSAIWLLLISCKEEKELPNIIMTEFSVGSETPIMQDFTYQNIPLDKPLSFKFSGALDPSSIENGIVFKGQLQDEVVHTFTLVSSNRELLIYPNGLLTPNHIYTLDLMNFKGANGEGFTNTGIRFITEKTDNEIRRIDFHGGKITSTGRYVNTPRFLNATIEFTDNLNEDQNLSDKIRLIGPSTVQLEIFQIGRIVIVKSEVLLKGFSKYQLVFEPGIESENGVVTQNSKTYEFFTVPNFEQSNFPRIPTEELLTKVQEQTFRYFWDFAHPACGMARERNTSGNLVTVGGSGFGVMAIVVGIERGFITRQQGVERLTRIVDFLEGADKFHGVWPHWLDGNTGKVLPFSQFDNGGDLVETAFMIQGLLTVKQYLDESTPNEKTIIDKITKLWEEVEWSWYTRGNQDVLYWHWSPQHEWTMNLPIRGYNESLIVYVLAASSPTFPISKSVYDKGWARNGNMGNGSDFYNITLPLGEDLGGPLFFSHYSFLGLDPRNLSDQYANYWTQSKNHTLINRMHVITNPLGYAGYETYSWGLTASDNHEGYSAHSPINDKGVITPTAALSSMPYTPEESIEALEFFYYQLGDRLWGDFGFYDAFNLTENWFADSYLAIDQGPIILMIENHRTALLWDLFMKDEEVKAGLDKLNFNY